MPSASDGLACGEPSVAERIPSSLQAALTDLVSWLDEANVPSIIIGGVAASVLGQPRLSFEEMAVRNGETHEIGGLRIRLPRVEDLLIMKAVARRPKDLQDIEALLSTHPDADFAFVRRWVAEFAAALNMPDMLDELERMLGQHKPTP
jgi:hypothetical protein